jgi:hypothetical protein
MFITPIGWSLVGSGIPSTLPAQPVPLAAIVAALLGVGAALAVLLAACRAASQSAGAEHGWRRGRQLQVLPPPRPNPWPPSFRASPAQQR